MRALPALVLSLLLVALMAGVIVLRAPAQFISWVLGLLLEMLAAIVAWAEESLP